MINIKSVIPGFIVLFLLINVVLFADEENFPKDKNSIFLSFDKSHNKYLVQHGNCIVDADKIKGTDIEEYLLANALAKPLYTRSKAEYEFFLFATYFGIFPATIGGMSLLAGYGQPVDDQTLITFGYASLGVALVDVCAAFISALLSSKDFVKSIELANNQIEEGNN
jgi:hypothetical protein